MTETVIERNVNQNTVDNLRNLALSHMESIKKLDKDIKQTNEMINDTLVGNSTYHESNEKVKEVTKKRKQVREQIMSSQEMIALATKRHDLKKELAEKKSALSDYLIEFERLSGKDVIENLSGEQLSIFKTATVVKLPND